MECQKYQTIHARVVNRWKNDSDDYWRRSCGCIKTSDKLKELLKAFPSPPPPSPVETELYNYPQTKHVASDRERLLPSNCISAYCTDTHHLPPGYPAVGTEITSYTATEDSRKKAQTSKVWQIVLELVQVVQLSVTAIALAIYYLIFCYMQLIYYTLRSALYFHNADGPMKITIGVMTITMLIVGFNLILRMERLIGIF